MVIKHIVIAGGGPSGFITYGVLKQLSNSNYWNIDNINSLYGTSVGAFFATVLCLNYEWNTLDDYLIERPWDKMIDIGPQTILNVLTASGALDPEIFTEKALEPLLTAKGLSKDITLLEFHNYCKKDLHVFTTEINSDKLQTIDLSHITHPDLKLVTCVAMSLAYPLVFRPICLEDKCYIDGGLVNNLPIIDCIGQKDCDKDEILVLKNIFVREPMETKITKETSIARYFSILFKKMRDEIDPRDKHPDLKNTVKCLCENLSGLDSWFEALTNKNMRKDLINNGISQANIFLEYKNYDKDVFKN